MSGNVVRPESWERAAELERLLREITYTPDERAAALRAIRFEPADLERIKWAPRRRLRGRGRRRTGVGQTLRRG